MVKIGKCLMSNIATWTATFHHIMSRMDQRRKGSPQICCVNIAVDKFEYPTPPSTYMIKYSGIRVSGSLYSPVSLIGEKARSISDLASRESLIETRSLPEALQLMSHEALMY